MGPTLPVPLRLRVWIASVRSQRWLSSPLPHLAFSLNTRRNAAQKRGSSGIAWLYNSVKSKLDRELKWNGHVHRDYTYFWDALHTITRTTVVISLKILPFFAVSLTTGRRIKSSVGTSSRTPVVSSQWGWEEEKYTNSRRKDSTHLTTHIWYKTLHFLPPPRFTTSPRQIYRNGALQLSSTGIFLPCRQYPCERHFPVILRHRLLRTAAGSFISHCPADTFSIASADN